MSPSKEAPVPNRSKQQHHQNLEYLHKMQRVVNCMQRLTAVKGAGYNKITKNFQNKQNPGKDYICLRGLAELNSMVYGPAMH